ncbi:MAG TPA: DUF3311 domain-containing protein [Pyrinomonadaceae bacterium]|nr:DUF3311 domain-containing protein [Pyrinomonadaceae bacterium]
MKRALLVLAVAALYVLHQDFWFWRTSRPLVLGVVPIGLFYHACYSVAASLLMWLLVRHAWPHYLEREVERLDAEGAEGGDES